MPRVRDHGLILADSNTQAVRLAAHIVGATDPAASSEVAEPLTRQPHASATTSQAPEIPSELPALFREGPRVINLGLESFATQLQACGVPVLHVDWQPPASGNTHLASLLERLK